MKKSEKGAKTIQVPHKYLKLEKSARKLADNSTCLQSDGFEINTGKSQLVNIYSGGFSLNKGKVSMIQHKGGNWRKSREGKYSKKST